MKKALAILFVTLLILAVMMPAALAVDDGQDIEGEMSDALDRAEAYLDAVDVDSVRNAMQGMRDIIMVPFAGIPVILVVTLAFAVLMPVVRKALGR